MKTEFFKMRSGALIPNLAFGTWQITNEDAARCVNDALEVGYIHIDTANAYDNEKGVGEAIRASKIAQAHNETPTQAAIRFDLQLGLLPLPKTTHKEYMIQNCSLDFTLTEAEMQELLSIKDDEQNHLP